VHKKYFGNKKISAVVFVAVKPPSYVMAFTITIAAVSSLQMHNAFTHHSHTSLLHKLLGVFQSSFSRSNILKHLVSNFCFISLLPHNKQSFRSIQQYKVNASSRAKK